MHAVTTLACLSTQNNTEFTTLYLVIIKLISNNVTDFLLLSGGGTRRCCPAMSRLRKMLVGPTYLVGFTNLFPPMDFV